MTRFSALLALAAWLSLSVVATAFTGPHISRQHRIQTNTVQTTTCLFERISKKRREQLGIGENEDEYDLGVALAQNTDDFISKVVAGSLIVTILALLIAGIVIPATTDYGEGVCNPLLTGGRC
jgi:hypothetical protein